jgi:hypothetical protein
MACADDTMDDFWKFVLNESEEDSRKGRRRCWFKRNKGVQTSEGDSYSDQGGGGTAEESRTETLENKIERAFDALFYEEPKKDRHRRFNWFRQKQNTEPEEDFLRGMTIFAPSSAGTSSNRGLITSNNSWFSAQDERNELQESRKITFKRERSRIFASELNQSTSNDSRWFTSQNDRNDVEQSHRANRKEKPSIFGRQ